MAKQWVVQEKAVDSPCLVGKATQTKVGAKGPHVHTGNPGQLEVLQGRGQAGQHGRARPERLHVRVREPALHLAKPPRSSLRGLRGPAFYAVFWLLLFSGCAESSLLPGFFL